MLVRGPFLAGNVRTVRALSALNTYEQNASFISVVASSCERPIFIIEQHTGEQPGNAYRWR